MDALAPGQCMAEIRIAAKKAAMRVNWSDEAVVAANPGEYCYNNKFRCRIPFLVTIMGHSIRYWLTDCGELHCSSPSMIADLQPDQRKLVLRALQALN